MKKWAVTEAKNQFGALIEAAQRDGPQMITRRGRVVAVLVDVDEFRRIAPEKRARRDQPKETVLEFFSRFKGLNLEGIRRRDLQRKIKL